MKKVTWKQKSIKKCIAWLLVFALILPMLPMEASADTETQAETLNPALEEISFCNFVNGSGVALADGTYSGTEKWVAEGWYYGDGQATTTSTLENKVINMDLTFGLSQQEVIYFGGVGKWEGLRLEHPANKDYLVLTDTYNQLDPVEIVPGDLDWKQLVGNEINFKLSYEIEKTGLKLGVWIDDVLYRNKYYTISEYDNHTKGYIHMYMGEGTGGSITVKSHRKQWDYSSPLEEITFRDMGIEDKTYYMNNAQWVLFKEYFGNTGIASAFAGKVINADVTFSAAPFNWRIGSEKWNDGTFAFYRDATTPDKAVYFGFNGTTYTLTSAEAGTDLVEDEFNLKISFQEVDTNADGTMDRLKVGLWFDNALYGNDYFIIDGDYSAQIYGLMTIHTMANSTGYVTFNSCERVLNPTLKQFTFSDFTSDISGTYKMSGSGWILLKEYYSNGTPAGAFSGKVLNGYVTFSSDPFNFRLGGGPEGWQWADTNFAFYRDANTPADALKFGFNGTTYTLTSDKAKTDLVDNKFHLKISFEEVDTNADGENDRLRLGLWFNDVLYNNKYFTVDGNYGPFVHGCVYIRGPLEGNGYVQLTSYKDKEKEGVYITETNTGDMNRVPYNNDEITADLGVGCASYAVVVDKNYDGYMDLMVGSNAVPFGGTHVFYGSKESQDSTSDNYMLMEKGRKITDLSNTFNATYLYDEIGNYEKTLLHGAMVIENDAKSTSWAISDAAEYPTVEALGWRVTVGWPSEIEGDPSSGFNPIRQNLADFDGDGKLDFITGWGCWDEYSEEEGITGANVSGDKFDSNGVWGDDNGDRNGDDDGDGDDDPLHAWIVWNKNTSESSELSLTTTYSDEAQLVYVYDYEVDEEGKKVAIESSKRPLDVYGGGYPQLCDWDNDGDLDIICASFISEITYFENIGSSTNPIYVEGRSIPMVGGGELELDGSMPSLTSFDWNNDGFLDMICGEEDGRVSLVQHSGEFDENNTPIMHAQTFFQTPADGLKDGVLNTPYSVDWDGDGDEDIITGNSSGYITFTKNLSVEKNQPLTNPIWDNPVQFTNPDGEVYRFVAGYNGSIQGPAEAKWGYTQVSVADWDGDGVLDIMSNNISGRVFWHRGIKGQPYMIEDARPVEVEWENEPLYPTWNWWKPEGNELVTQWRTTPYMIDVPLDEDGDGIAEGDGLVDLVTMDHEGYLSFFQRYRDTDGTLKLKEGQRIFKAADGTSALRFSSNLEGKSGKIAYLLVDFDMDGDLDIIRSNNVNAGMFENIATTPGTYVFQEKYATGLHSRMLADHTPAPAVCDWNQDNIPDLLIGTMDGHYYYLINPVVTEDDTTTEGPENPAEHLVAHWDFEETDDGVYADKATAGTVEDTLTMINESNVTIADGIASINNNGCLVAADSDDLDQTGKMTIFARVKIAAGAYYSLIDKRGVGTGDGIRAYAIALAPGNPAGMNAGFAGNYTGGWLDVGAWREIAMVVDTNESGKLTVELLMSKNTATEDGNDFITVLKATTSYTALNNATAALGIGNTPTEIANRSALREFDDVRIYNTALSNAQLAELISADKGDATSYYLSAFGSNLPIDFASTTTSYAVTTTKDTVILAPKTEDAGVTVKVNGTTVASGVANSYPLNVGANTYTITTTDSAGTVQKTYTITITRDEVAQPTLTKEELKTAIDTAKAMQQGQYSNGSWMVLQDMIVSAQGIYDNTESTEAGYYTAKVALDDATNKLTTAFTRADLLWLMEEVASDYPEDTEIADLITTSEKITAMSVASTQEMKEAYNNLLAKAMGTVIVQAEVKDSIAMNYYAVVNETLTSEKDATPYMTFTVNGKTSDAIVGELKDAESNIYTFACPKMTKIMAQDMADTITATLTVGNYSKTYEYSVLDYCADILKAETLTDNSGTEYTEEELASMKDLVVDLTQYGASVQTYANETIGNAELLTSKLKGKILGYVEYDKADKTSLNELAGVFTASEKLSGGTESDTYTWKGATLVFKDKINIRGKFEATKDVVNTLTMKVSVDGNEVFTKPLSEVAVATGDEGMWCVDYSDIYGYEYSQKISITFYDDDVVAGKTLNYSVNTYLNAKKDTTNDALKNLLLGINGYGDAALAFHSAISQ